MLELKPSTMIPGVNIIMGFDTKLSDKFGLACRTFTTTFILYVVYSLQESDNFSCRKKYLYMK